MIELKDVEHLAGLARIAVSDGEKELFRNDLEEILAYVSQIKEVTEGEQLTTDTASRTFDGMQVEIGELHNVMREDGEPHDSGMFTEDLIAAAPSREGNHVFVKKILGDN